MRNYIILNGNNSNEITGLLIQTLPPISQPKIRTNIEEIDGRDGDIITKLGYSAYNKEISIGLYGNYNVDDIIKYFTDNQSGKVTFSDEPDKYYYYEILDQVDFDKLIRYRTATVTLHCQPFKYSTTEEKIQIDATEVSGSGSDITLNNTEDGALFTSLQINGDTSQETTTGLNYLPITLPASTTQNGITLKYDSTTGWLTISGTATSNVSIVWNFDDVLMPATTYIQYENDFSTSSSQIGYMYNSTNVSALTFSGLNRIYDRSSELGNQIINQCYFYVASGTTINGKCRPMITQYSTQQTWEPYTNGASPNPDYPQDVNVVTGDNTIDVVGKNLLNIVDGTYSHNGLTATITNGQISVSGTSTASSFLSIIFNTLSLKAGTYTLSANNSSSYNDNDFYLRITTKNGSNVLGPAKMNVVNAKTTFTLNEDLNEGCLQIRASSGDTLNNFIIRPQLEKGSTATTYEPYKSQTYDIDLGSIELCKIGDYQDYIYKENGNWYKYSAIGKVVLDGSNYTIDGWGYNNRGYILISDMKSVSYSNNISFLTHFSFDTTVYSDGQNNVGYCNRNSNQTSGIYIRFGSSSEINTQSKANTWLSNNLPILYYQLATPTTTQITDTTLLSQLEALAGATTYLGQTNIITNGSDLNPLLEVTTFAVDDPSFVITNSGNINSKPIITIYGLGTVGLYLNGIQVLSLDMGETTSQITIDVAKLEAYNQETGALMNRNVTGDYNNLSLNVGENTITESGTLQGLEVENYSRWL